MVAHCNPKKRKSSEPYFSEKSLSIAAALLHLRNSENDRKNSESFRY